MALWISKVVYFPTLLSVDFEEYKSRIQRLEMALIFITLMFGLPMSAEPHIWEFEEEMRTPGPTPLAT